MAERRRPILPWILFGITLLLLVAVLLSSLAPERSPRVVLDDERNEQAVFVEIPVEGVIVDAAVEGVNPVAWVGTSLRRAAREEKLGGILLRVDSPGGGIRASDVILRAIREFRREHEIPVVVWMKDVAASGGYYVSLASDWIVAHEDTITGSIGVIWPTVNWRVLTREKLGLELDAIKSARMKDIGSPNRAMTSEERRLIQGYVDDAYAKFVRLVVEGRKKSARPVTEESVRALASTILTGRKALEAGLVDQLGYREDAVAKLKALAGVERADVVEYAKPKSLFETIFSARAPVSPVESRLRRLERLYAEGPPLMSLWER